MAEATRKEDSQEILASAAVGSQAGTKEKFDVSSTSSLADVNDPLTRALHSLFTSFADDVQGELQCFNEYELLQDMNLRTAEEYDNFGDFASGLLVFVERLNHKNGTFNQYRQEIDGIDRQVTDLEALVSTLDNYSNTQHTQIRNAFADSIRPICNHSEWFLPFVHHMKCMSRGRILPSTSFSWKLIEPSILSISSADLAGTGTFSH